MSAGDGDTALPPAALLGTWVLTDHAIEDAAGNVVERLFGDRPTGRLVYCGDGTVSVHLMSAGIRRLATHRVRGGTVQEKAAAYDGYLGYSGSWVLSGTTLVHHIDLSSFPNYVGTSQLRRIALIGDVLTLSSDPVQSEAGPVAAVATWRRPDTPIERSGGNHMEREPHGRRTP